MVLLAKQTVFSLVLTSCLALTATNTLAQSSPDGYETLDTPVAVRPESAEAGKVEVLEFFWFGCPHCFAFEPSISEWSESKPDYVNFVREAPPLNPSWLSHSQTFYASQIMGVTEVVFEPFFEAIHVDRIQLRDPEAIAEFVGTLGVDSAEFLSKMKSPEVMELIENSMELATEAMVRGVPAILVNGKYMTGGSIAGGHEQIIEVINTLTEQEKQ